MWSKAFSSFGENKKKISFDEFSVPEPWKELLMYGQ